MINDKLVIAVDFDGTIATRSFPEVGNLIFGADVIIRRLHGDGHRIIINTCRTGKMEGMAQDFLDENLIPYDFINANLPELITEYKQDCRKISADVYIDDKNLFGIPSWEEIYDRLQDIHEDLLDEQAEIRERRMDIIAQNGNDGLHYTQEHPLTPDESYE
tara:strand:+ start:709 stop:1191 length:483 start_codon:yes stop_codon:yes gene_type:complete